MKKGHKNQARNGRGQFVKSPTPPSSLANTDPFVSHDSQPTTSAVRSNCLTYTLAILSVLVL